MDVGAQPNIVSQIPTDMVGIFVNHDVIAIPQPVAAIADVDRGHTKVEAAEPEPAGTAALKPERVAGTESGAEMAVLPGMVQMKARVVLARVVSNPFPVCVDMRSCRVSWFVGERTIRDRSMAGATDRSGPVSGRVSGHGFVATFLAVNTQRECQQSCKRKVFHVLSVLSS